MSQCKHVSKLKQKWSTLAQLSFQMDDFDEQGTNHSSKEGDSIISEQKIDKILDWLQSNGVKQGLPTSLKEDAQDVCRQRILLKEQLLRVQPSILKKRSKRCSPQPLLLKKSEGK